MPTKEEWQEQRERLPSWQRAEDVPTVKAIFTCIERLESGKPITPQTRDLLVELLSELFYVFDDVFRKLNRSPRRGRPRLTRSLLISLHMHSLVRDGYDQRAAAKSAAKQYRVPANATMLDSMTRRYREHRRKGLLAHADKQARPRKRT